MFWLKGFKIEGWQVDGLKKYVIVAVPHTSNWDLIYAIAVFSILKVPLRFTIKDSWMRFPFHLIMKPLGAIGIDRSQRKGMVEHMADILQKTDAEMALLVTPEGTRSRVDRWKSGFYQVAQLARVPVALGFIDYKRKVAGIGKLVYITGDKQADLEEIVNFYSAITPKYPEKSYLGMDLLDSD